MSAVVRKYCNVGTMPCTLTTVSNIRFLVCNSKSKVEEIRNQTNRKSGIALIMNDEGQ